MYPRPIKNYFAPDNVEQALQLLQEYSTRARLLSGGQSLIPQLKARETTAECLIDLNRVDGLSTIELSGDELVIGAMVRHADVIKSPLVALHCPLLVDAVNCVGDPQVRNRGTLGGSLAFADPLADLPVATIAVGARIVARAEGGKSRIIDIDAFFRGPRQTALAPDELLVEIRIPVAGPRGAGAYCKQSHVMNGTPLICIGVQLELDESSACARATIVVGGLHSMPARAEAAMKRMIGARLDAKAIADAARLAAAEIEVPADFRASAEYRRNLIRHYVGLMTRTALARAGSRT